MNNELMELIKDNPDLPVFAWVYSDVVSDDYGTWLGQFSTAYIKEYAKVESYGYGDCTWVFKDEPEDYIEWLIETKEYEELTQEEAEKKAKDVVDNLEYKKAIFVYVDLPKDL